MMRIASLTRQDGFTVVEMMIAAMLLMVGVLGTVALVDGANATTLQTRAREGGTNLAREVVEDARSVDYEDVRPGAIEQRLRAKPGLDANPGASVWRVERRGFTYTVTADACTVDDGKDGAGEREQGSTFCSSSVAPGTVDDDPEDYKRVTVEVTWGNRGGTRSVRQTGIVPHPGQSIGVGIESISGPVDVTPNGPTPYLYTVSTNKDAKTVDWWADGQHQDPAEGQGREFEFTWTAEACDGVHHLAAQAYDKFGRSAGMRVLTVRTRGSAPCSGAAGGSTTPPPPSGSNNPPTRPGTLSFTVTGRRVRLQWGASTDPDPGDSVASYRVYRNGTLLATVRDLDYTDSSTGGTAQSYHVVAVDTRGATSEPSNTVEYWPRGYTP